jgi:beta-xylosidase
MVFVDDDDSAYLYWGQGHCYVVKLNEDMISFDPRASNITPPGYNEGAFVIKRNGLYYLMWSEYDTRDPRYSVAYGTATSPLGPFQKAENNPILQGKGLVQGAGHHSVVQVPGNGSLVHRLPSVCDPRRLGLPTRNLHLAHAVPSRRHDSKGRRIRGGRAESMRPRIER